MKLIEQYVEYVDVINDGIALDMLMKLEEAGRVCYKSEDKVTEDSHIKFIKNLILRGHESVLEHASITLKWVTDRGVSHELVRHRIASYSQESTRYCNYSHDELIFIYPVDFDFDQKELKYLEHCEDLYNHLVHFGGRTPQQARAILPNCLKTEIVITMNIREWRHMLRLRTSKAAHPQMRDMASMTLDLLCNDFPILFEDLKERETNESNCV